MNPLTSRFNSPKNSTLPMLWIVLSVVVLFLAAIYCSKMLDRATRAKVGPAHVFRLTSSPAFLSEELALAKSEETLALDEPRINGWKPLEDRLTKAPNGRLDIYMLRDAPNSGQIQFVLKSGNEHVVRQVQIALDGDRIITHTLIPP